VSDPEQIPIPAAKGRERRASTQRPAGLSAGVAIGITVAWLVVALAVGLGAVAVQQYETRLRATSLEAPATVTEIVTIRGGYNVRVRFVTATGKEVVALLDDFPRDPGLHAGEQLRVRYDPDRPDRVLWDVREPLDFSGARNALIVLSAVLAFAAIAFFAIARHRRRARR